jgi:hypothetical protein
MYVPLLQASILNILFKAIKTSGPTLSPILVVEMFLSLHLGHPKKTIHITGLFLVQSYHLLEYSFTTFHFLWLDIL